MPDTLVILITRPPYLGQALLLLGHISDSVCTFQSLGPKDRLILPRKVEGLIPSHPHVNKWWNFYKQTE